MAVYWEQLNISLTESVGNAKSLNFLWIPRDYAPELICYNILIKNCKRPETNTIKKYRAGLHTEGEKTKFASYLAGLIEGDATILVAKPEKSIKGIVNYPSIKIMFHLKDLPLALMVQKNLGYGSLIRKKGINAYSLTVNSKSELLLLVSLINGHMRTPKIYSLWKLIDWLNIKNSNLNLIKKPLKTSCLIGDAWLSGFIESHGRFSIKTTQKDKLIKWECKFEVINKQIDHNGISNLYFLENIAEFLFTVVKPIRLNNSKPEYRIRTTNLKGNLNIESYLKIYPLFGSKHLDFKSWTEVLNLFKSSRLGTVDPGLNIEKVTRIKSNMNDKRTIFVWDHLKNFYNLDK